jgi:hypothetical protein
MTKSSSLGIPMSPQEISKKDKRQILGMPHGTPSSSTKYHVIFEDTIFLLLYMLCVFLGASLFSLSVLFSFVYCYNVTPHLWIKVEHLCYVLFPGSMIAPQNKI